MDSFNRFVAALAVAMGSIGAESLSAQVTTTVSVNSSGVQGNGDTYAPVLSVDGRYVAFQSFATNLVAGDTNAVGDIFVRDRHNGTTERVSVSSTGAQQTLVSKNHSLSADGRFVAFSSQASHFVTGDTNGTPDVFVRNRIAGTTERASVSSNGTQANYQSLLPSLSANGRYVAFESYASNLVAGDTNGTWDVFVRDRASGTTERVSVNSAGAQGDAESGPPSISADGRFVAFASVATNLVAGDTNASDDIFVRDRSSGTTERVSVKSGGVGGNSFSQNPCISADGRCVAFESDASNLVAGDTNSLIDIFVHDRFSNTTTRVSVDSTGVQGGLESRRPSISGDGQVVTFKSLARDFVSGDNNNTWDIFVHDRISGTTVRVSVDANGSEGWYASESPSISADGRFVAFDSLAPNLFPGDMNAVRDAVMYDRGALPPVNFCTSGTSTNGCLASIAVSANPSISFANSCILTVTGVEGLKSCILFYGIDNSVFTPGPWATGSTSTLCVKSPAQRTLIQNSGGTFNNCNGFYTLDWNAYQSAHPLALGNPWIDETKVYAQAWFRDPFAVKSTNLSDALEMTYVP